jgi:hypothetical protein
MNEWMNEPTLTHVSFMVSLLHQLQWNLSMLANFVSSPGHTSGQLMKPTWHYENWTPHNHLCKCTVQSAEPGGLLGQQTQGKTLSINRELKCSNGSVAPRKFQPLVETCGEGMDDDWAKGSSTMNEDFGLCTPWRKKYTTLMPSSEEV